MDMDDMCAPSEIMDYVSKLYWNIFGKWLVGESILAHFTRCYEKRGIWNGNI